MGRGSPGYARGEERELSDAKAALFRWKASRLPNERRGGSVELGLARRVRNAERALRLARRGD